MFITYDENTGYITGHITYGDDIEAPNSADIDEPHIEIDAPPFPIDDFEKYKYINGEFIEKTEQENEENENEKNYNQNIDNRIISYRKISDPSMFELLFDNYDSLPGEMKTFLEPWKNKIIEIKGENPI